MKMSLKCRVQIGIEGLSEHEAGAVKTALEPDNVRMPEDMQVTVTTNGKNNAQKCALVLEFIGQDSKGTHGIGHVVGTVDEVLEHIQVVLKVIRQC